MPVIETGGATIMRIITRLFGLHSEHYIAVEFRPIEVRTTADDVIALAAAIRHAVARLQQEKS